MQADIWNIQKKSERASADPYKLNYALAVNNSQ